MSALSINCVLTVLVLRIESAADIQEPAISRNMAITYIQQDLMVLQELRDLPSVEGALDLMEKVIQYRGITVLTTSSSNQTGTSMDCVQAESLLECLPRTLFDGDEPLIASFEDILGTDILEYFNFGGF